MKEGKIGEIATENVLYELYYLNKRFLFRANFRANYITRIEMKRLAKLLEEAANES